MKAPKRTLIITRHELSTMIEEMLNATMMGRQKLVGFTVHRNGGIEIEFTAEASPELPLDLAPAEPEL
jgi:hypothetical protein